ncbi:dihydropyrimidine dehydrogenase subunit A [compost metagenome]
MEDRWADGMLLAGGRIAIDAEGRTSREGVWAGGDCTDRGDDLTVTGVAQRRDAAESIHRHLSVDAKSAPALEPA